MSKGGNTWTLAFTGWWSIFWVMVGGGRYIFAGGWSWWMVVGGVGCILAGGGWRWVMVNIF